MEILAERLASVRPSLTKHMTQRAAGLKAEGQKIITLSQGEPDFDTPVTIGQAGAKAISEGKTRYTAVAGNIALREAIVKKFDHDNGLKFSTDEITVGCGAKQVLFNALFATINPGNEVVIPVPCWVSYPDMVRLAGGKPVTVECQEKNKFKLTSEQLEAHITSATKWLMLNSPSNPTGAVYTEEELKSLAEVLRRHSHVWVLCDDIYEKLVYDGARFSTLACVAPDLKSRILTINGVSKAYAMTGWRVGYGAGPERLIKAMNTIQGQTSSHTSSISQEAATAALNGSQHFIEDFVRTFQKRRDLVVKSLNQIPHLNCHWPDGAFYVFPSCAGVIGKTTPKGKQIETDSDFAMYLLEDAGVAVVPGSGFLMSPYIRISYASSEEDLTDAMVRIAVACNALK